MSMIDVKCPNCGAPIKINDAHDAHTCEYCGSSFLTSAAVINNGTYINNQTINNVKQDNLWTYKAQEEKSNVVIIVVMCVVVIAFMIFVFLMPTF